MVTFQIEVTSCSKPKTKTSFHHFDPKQNNEQKLIFSEHK